ncbi:hypothetical protein GCM10010435_44100 [Winogradskya consettensis]|uniref:Uncharacterized protein n=1 Tax=Winogradskya consettensis TaxID=113560 RepID=A0A919T371_9ACTN|nr:hypothetical protein [Actinoplanes consettensis]GIM82633.1 hypothetical protein Aco04nite_82490 [Actinoplanes consettensis]
MPISDKPKVYLTSFMQLGTGDHAAVALADDGEVLAEHVCSSPTFFRGDLHDRPFRHDAYLRKYGAWGDGDRYELVECWSFEVPAEVIERNRLLHAEEQDSAASRPYPSEGGDGR